MAAQHCPPSLSYGLGTQSSLTTHVSDLALGMYFGLFPSLGFQSYDESFKYRNHSSSLFSRAQVLLSVNMQ